MRFDSLLTPVAEGDPCGPDLDEAGDEAYLNYVLAAGGRIPDSFYRRDPDAPINEPRYVVFDRSTIDLRAEVTAVAGLLQRTRDIRLLTLEARFQALAGQVVGFCECIDAIAELIERYWDAIHPRGEGSDFTLRQNTIAGLDDQASILLPLAHAPFVVSKKIGAVSLRDYQTASGSVTARAEDREVALSDVLAALQEPPMRAGLDVLARAVQQAERSLGRIQRVFVENAGYEYDPGVDNLRGVLKQMQGALATAIPDLVAPAVVEEAPPALELSAAPAAAAGIAPARAPSDIPSHQAADAALLAVQRYFVRYEPSSPAVILVHQARTLIGKPLAELLEMLLPGGVANARIELVKGSRFSLSMPELKQVTQDLLGDAGPAANDVKLPDYTAKSRREVEDLLGRIEAFFRSSEPSSPVLMLLDRVKHFMAQDFSAIVTDILGAQTAAGARGEGAAASTLIASKPAVSMSPQPKPVEPQEAAPDEPAAPESEAEAATEAREAPPRPLSAAATAVLQRIQRPKSN